MSQKIQVRRGTDAERASTTFDQGEPVWTTDTKTFYMGDGSTAGGISVGSSSLDRENTTVVSVSDDTDGVANYAALKTAILSAYGTTPYGLPLSRNNPFTILVPPAKYKTSGPPIILSGEGIHVMGMTSNPLDVKVIGEPDETIPNTIFTLNSSFGSLKNMSFLFTNTGYGNACITLYGHAEPTLNNNLETFTVQNVHCQVSGSTDGATNFEIHASSTATITEFHIRDSYFGSGGFCDTEIFYGLYNGAKLYMDNVVCRDDSDVGSKAAGCMKMPYADNLSDVNAQLFANNCSFIATQNTVLNPKSTPRTLSSMWNNCFFSGYLGVGAVKYTTMQQSQFRNNVFTNCSFAGGPVFPATKTTKGNKLYIPIFNGCTFAGTGGAVFIRTDASGIFNTCKFVPADGGVSISGQDTTSSAIVVNSIVDEPYDTLVNVVESNNVTP